MTNIEPITERKTSLAYFLHIYSATIYEYNNEGICTNQIKNDQEFKGYLFRDGIRRIEPFFEVIYDKNSEFLPGCNSIVLLDFV